MGMSKMELAKELGVSKQTITNYFAKCGLSNGVGASGEPYVKREGKLDILSDEAVRILSERIEQDIPEELRFIIGGAAERQRVLALKGEEETEEEAYLRVFLAGLDALEHEDDEEPQIEEPAHSPQDLALIAALREHLETLESQLVVKDEQIAEAHKLAFELAKR